MSELAEKADEDVRALLVELTAKPNPPGSIEQKVADFYSSYLDTDSINKLGLAPFQPTSPRSLRSGPTSRWRP